MEGDRSTRYTLEVQFQPGSERPAHVFRAMSELIEAFQEIDSDLAKSVSAEIEAVAVLDDVEVGSIRARLSTVLKSVDDSALKKLDWKELVGTYLVHAKKRIVHFLDQTPTVVNQQQIAVLEQDLLHLAEETNVRQIPAYAPIPRRRLLMRLNRIGTSVAALEETDSARLVIPGETVEINRHFRIPEDAIDALVTAETIGSRSTMILKVKKPDYLGNSMWEFRHETRSFEAKILDVTWLQGFQNRQIHIRPGDSIRAIVSMRVHYDQYGEVVATHYEIGEVQGVIPMPAWSQLSLDADGVPPDEVG